MLQTKERWAGAEDVISAREQEGTDGATGGTDEAAQGDTQTLFFSMVYCHTLGGKVSFFTLHLPVCPGSNKPHFSLCCFLLDNFTFFQLWPYLTSTFLSFLSLFVSDCPCCGPVGWGTATGSKFTPPHVGVTDVKWDSALMPCRNVKIYQLYKQATFFQLWP